MNRHRRHLRIAATGGGAGGGAGGGGGGSAVEDALTLTNPGFETGDLTGWTTGAGNPYVTTGGRSGTYRLIGSSNAASFYIYQDIDVSDYATEIDAGDLYVWGRMWHKGAAFDNDAGAIQFGFYDDGPSLIADQIGNYEPRDENAWYARDLITPVPSGTRTIRVYVAGSRATGTELSVYVDDVAVVLLDSSLIAPLLNAGFEAGDLSNWTTDLGTPYASNLSFSAVGSPHTGSYGVSMSAQSAAGEIHQDVAVPAALESAVDAGDVQAVLVGFTSGNPGDSDNGRLELEFYDDNPTLLDTLTGDDFHMAGVWRCRSVAQAVVPSGTRTVRVIIHGTRGSPGTYLDSYWDDLVLHLTELTV